MRSSKSRSRSKSNRNNNGRTLGNIVNRVFDSSGPEGKVRGTPQQIIDKYNQLARDAQLSGDRVATENFQQHAEHYMRMLSAAQAEQDAKREEQERQNRERQAERDRERAARQERESGGRSDDQGQGQQGQQGDQPKATKQGSPSEQGDKPSRSRRGNRSDDPGNAPQPDVLDIGSDEGDNLVETPENKAEKPKRPRTRKPKADTSKADAPKDDSPKADASKAGDDAAKPTVAE